MVVLGKTDIKEYKTFRAGKARDVYALGDKLLIIATDRISVFDVVMPTLIPYKGVVLNKLALFWFEALKDVVKNHILTDDLNQFPPSLRKYELQLRDRSVLVRKTNPIMLECVVRGYLAGNAWKDYEKHGEVYGHKLPKGLVISEKLPEPIFTPAIKSVTIDGHDEYVPHQRAIDVLGREMFLSLRHYSLRLYEEGHKIALRKGILIADTKFEFGLLDSEIILIDEIFTPDSSRFWPERAYQKGKAIESLDKEFVRSYVVENNLMDQLASVQLPESVIKETTRRYIEIYEILTGKKLDL